MRIHPAYCPRVYLLVLLLLASSTMAQTKRMHPDIENIGKRDLAPKIWGIFPSMTPEHEDALGAQIAREFEITVKLLDDALVSDYVTRLGRRLVQHSDAKSSFEFKIVDSEESDLTAFPAGHIFVNTGLVVAASNESELAAVISKAIAHVAAHHGVQMLVKARVLQIDAMPLLEAMAFHWSGKYAQVVIELKGIKSEYEVEADQLAIQYLWNTGYDPAAYITVLEKLPKQQLNAEERLWSAMMEKNSLPDRRPYNANSPELDAVKSHLLKRRQDLKATVNAKLHFAGA